MHDKFSPNLCIEAEDSICMDLCVALEFDDPANFKNPYSLFPNDCYDFADRVLDECRSPCK